MADSPQGPGPSGAAGETAVEEMADRLAHTEQLVAQLKDLIREKDAALGSKDEQLKVRRCAETEAGRSRLEGTPPSPAARMLA